MAAYLIRIELRRRWRGYVLLALVTGVVVGVVLASVAGARRAETAFDRYLQVYEGGDVAAFGDPEALASIPAIDAVDRAIAFELVGVFPEADQEGFYPFVASDGGELGRDWMRAPLSEGRYADPDEPFEVALSERTARRLGVEVGDDVPLVSFSPTDIESWEGGDEVDPSGPPASLEVVGIVRDPGDIGAREGDITLTFLSEAFRDAVPRSEVGSVGNGAMVRVAPGHDLAEVRRALAGRDVELDTSLSTDSSESQITPTLGSIATSTRIFALVAAIGGLIALGQAISRLQSSAAADDSTLVALGASRTGRWQRLAAPSVIAVVAGAVLGVPLALALSVLFPVGLARAADPDLGVHVDGPTTVIGVVVSLFVLAALAAVMSAWRVRAAGRGASVHPSRWSRLLADLGAPPAAVTGVSLGGRTQGRPGRIAVAGTLLCVLGLLSTLVFSASVNRLVQDPALYGWGWDASIEGADLTDLGEAGGAMAPRLRADPDVEGAASLYTQVPVALDDVPLFATALAEDDTALRPVLVDGTLPTSASEVAVGRDDLSDLHASVGDEVELEVGSDRRRVVISGVVAFPVPEDGGSSATGVYLAPGLDRGLLDELCAESESCTRTIAVALRDRVDLAAFADRYTDPDQGVEVALPTPPGEVDRLRAVEDLPRYLAAFLALLAAAALSFATTTTVRERRRDLAMLRVLGMTSRQVRATVVVLVLALTALGALLGVGLGVVVGRQVWRAVTTAVALPFAPSIPLAAVVLVPLATVVLAQLVASTSRRAAGRTPAAVVLRSE